MEPEAGEDARPLASMVKGWRERSSLTQAQLAAAAGLNVRTIRRIESGDSGDRLQISTTNLLAAALELSTSERALLLAVARGAPVHTGCSPVFTGRAAELTVLDDLAGDPAAMVVAQIDGMAGVGKTALATCVAQRLADRYPDGQIFLDLHAHAEGMRPVEPDAALERLLHSLGVASDEVPRGLDERAALYRSRLAGRRVLLLFDNVLDERQIAPLLPGTAGGLVLITGRRRLVGLDLTRSLALGVMTPADSVELLAKSVGDDRVRGEPAERLHELVELCGRLPMAMRIAGARMRCHPSWTVADLVERLREHRSRASELDAGPGLSITAMLDVSYQHLPAAAQRLYRLLGLHPGPDITVDDVAALAGSTPRAAERQVEPLLDLQLLHEHAPGRYRFHDLTRHDAAARCGRVDPEPDRCAALDRLLDHRGRASPFPVER
ncbi:NB-ARC domain-containing protein [Pseudonocardia sp. TRM90224]|uniref:NB-ARC domain-containing protein n=1 Tax=Pseudonocardia sp. TRM90224 TaxID=2812678 RepID=UPI001E462797|nr:NB-ARC domain-containing protein [Pseudonocardia sp. TRM90224]